MPGGQKSKLCAHEKHCQAQGEAHGVEGVQETATEDEVSPCSSPFGSSPQSSPAAGSPQGPERVPLTPTDVAGVSCTRAAEGAEGQEEGNLSSSEPPPPTESSQRDPLRRSVCRLLDFLLEKYKTKEPISKAEMMKVINKKFKGQFPEILRRACEQIEVVFGLNLKEVDSKGQCYAVVSNLEISHEENLFGDRGYPKNGLLMPLLGLIYMNGNRVTEEKIWEFLNVLGFYDGKRDVIFGDPRKLITKDLVQEKYLEYQQVPNSDPPRYEFLWGPRAHAEANKTKVLEFLAKVNDMQPTAFPAPYEETWREKEGGATAEDGPNAAARANFRAESSRPSFP
ncbi:melanoma-associated antigen B2-like [Orycteropus afer afer]|uniref:Melanoma-associated antigen B2-like n=1 Tax=Orycteropus afer afer TaxID=1230840 RepID=A0A8B7B2J5_ORYAF|nr:melanoma-associated antigen B2-like [Orycteropus afer afer]